MQMLVFLFSSYIAVTIFIIIIIITTINMIINIFIIMKLSLIIIVIVIIIIIFAIINFSHYMIIINILLLLKLGKKQNCSINPAHHVVKKCDKIDYYDHAMYDHSNTTVWHLLIKWSTVMLKKQFDCYNNSIRIRRI